MTMTVAQAHKLTSYILGEYPCHPFLGSSQYDTVSKLGEFRNEYMCAEAAKSHDDNNSKVKHITKHFLVLCYSQIEIM